MPLDWFSLSHKRLGSLSLSPKGTIFLSIKIWQIAQPRFAIQQKFAASGIIRVWTYEKVGRVIRLESESNTCILDEYG